MRYYIIIISLLTLTFAGCKHQQKQAKVQLFDYIIPQAGYIVKINKANAILTQNPIITDYYLNFTDKSFLSKAGFDTPYLINILQNKSKINGFVATGQLRNIDSLFNGKSSVYEQDTILSTTYKNTVYYATKLKGSYFISNQQLFIENCIRDQQSFGQLYENQYFKKGIASLDNDADMNLIVCTTRLKPDVFFNSSLKIKWQDTGSWQFLDLVETEKQIASGISLSRDDASVLEAMFESIQPVRQDFSSYIPFAVDETLTLNFDNFEQFVNNLNNIKLYAPQQTVEGRSLLSGLNGFAFFKENTNYAIILQLSDVSEFTGDKIEKIKDFNNYEIDKFPYNNLIDSYFSNILPTLSARYFSIIDDKVLITSTKAYLEKILNDIQNHSTLSHSKIYQNLSAELPDNYHLVLFKNRIAVNGRKYMKVQTFKFESGTVFTNLVLKKYIKNQGQQPVEQILTYDLPELPESYPQLVYNHKTKDYNIIYQDDKERLNFVNLKGKTLWQTELKDKIIGKIRQVDILRNHKVQYTFVTSHHWYVIDRLGHFVDKFPQYFLQKITQGISVFDYEHNRKYRFGITQSNKFKLFDNKAEKVKGFKVKIDKDIQFSPRHFRIGNKDFIQISDNTGRLYLLNRRGETRIKVSETFETSRNRWGVIKHKFANIDDKDRLLSIDLSGKLKSGKINLPEHILSEIRYETLAAVSENKLLINDKIIELDLGTYARPHIYKSGKHLYIFVANTDNNKIYAFDHTGKSLPNFPIIGQQILDIKNLKQSNYLLVYNSTHDLIVYKF